MVPSAHIEVVVPTAIQLDIVKSLTTWLPVYTLINQRYTSSVKFVSLEFLEAAKVCMQVPHDKCTVSRRPRIKL